MTQPVFENKITFKLPEVSGRVIRSYLKNSLYSIGDHVIQVGGKINSVVPRIFDDSYDSCVSPQEMDGNSDS